MKSIAFFFVLLLSSVQAKIVETPHFAQVSSYVSPETLLILDIDDTLLITPQMLGCDEWFLHRLKMYQQSGLSSKEALDKSLAVWESVRHITKMEVVEPSSVGIVHSLQEKKYCIMGLTSQGLALATRTTLQLLEHGIDLSLTAPSKEDCYLLVDKHGVLFRDGILFTSGTSKGAALFQLCDKIGYHPKRIVFLNDKATHIADVETAAEKKGVEFIGLRYSYSDARKKAFRPEIAEYQFSHSTFSRLLSDQEAKAAMDHKK